MSKFGDLMQEFFTSDPKRMLWFSRTMPASFWERQGRKRALDTFHFVAEQVPAYTDFLKKHDLSDHREIRTYDAFTRQVPLTDKRSYITHYPVEQLVTKKIPALYTLSTTSGTTGQPTVWFRSLEQDRMLPRYIGALYRNVWQIDHHQTLFVNTLALGSSNAGELVNFAIKQLCADPELQLTIATPGANVEQALATIRLVARHYDLIILGGYPSFMKLLFEEGVRTGLDWPSLNIKIQTGGEAYSETWRQLVTEQVLPKAKRDSLDFHIDTYGSTDAGGIGFGSPLTNIIRDLSRENERFCETLFGRPHVPTVVQYNPMAYLIETLPNGHLVITNRSAMPLVRYDTQDIGGIISYEKMMATVREFDYDLLSMIKKRGVSKQYSIWRYPLVYLYFRESSITVASANVYPANVAEIIEKSAELHGFKLSKKEDSSGHQQFLIYLELKGQLPSPPERHRLEEKYRPLILAHLRKRNLDFNQAYMEDPALCEPKLVIHGFREGPFAEDARRTKPKLVI